MLFRPEGTKESGGGAYALAGAALLVLLPLISYALRTGHANRAQQQQQRDEEEAAAAKVVLQEEALEGVRVRMREWYQRYHTAIKERDTLSARLQDPDEELKNLFDDEALQDPNKPMPDRRMELNRHYLAAVERATALQSEGEALKRDYNSLGGGKNKDA